MGTVKVNLNENATTMSTTTIIITIIITKAAEVPTKDMAITATITDVTTNAMAVMATSTCETTAMVGHRLHYLKRFIDDILSIWLVDLFLLEDPQQDPKRMAFQEDLKTFGRLRWIVNALSTKAVFIDLDITLVSDVGFSFTKYQKDLNLHLTRFLVFDMFLSI
jgi:hypothetical protein